MDTPAALIGRLPRQPEDSVKRRARLARETLTIAQARSDLAHGLGIDDDALEPWLDALEFDETIPLPTAPARTTR